MKVPQSPPTLSELLSEFRSPELMAPVLQYTGQPTPQVNYLHWDKLRRLQPPVGLNHRQWWLALKVQRHGQEVPLLARDGTAFSYSVPDFVHADLHEIDLGSGGMIGIPGSPITNWLRA